MLDVREEAKGAKDESWDGWWQEVTRGARKREDDEILRRFREKDVEAECTEVGSEVAELRRSRLWRKQRWWRYRTYCR